MRKLTISLFFLFIVSIAHAQTAQEILEKSKQAMGGNAWDAIRTTHSTGKLVTGGLSGQGESWENNLNGHYADKYNLGPASGAEGFDGKVVWTQDSSGEPRVEGAEAARAGRLDGRAQAVDDRVGGRERDTGGGVRLIVRRHGAESIASAGTQTGDDRS